MVQHNNLSSFQTWVLAIRPKTLPAAAAPVIVGLAIAWWDGFSQLIPALACLVSALLLQIGSNLANDVFDYEQGADDADRLGPTRVTQAGLLTPGQVKQGMGVVFGLTIIIGVYLIFIGGWPILILGVTAILSAIAYTGGPYPLGYHGLGDLFVFIFFGLAATAGTYYIQVGKVSSVVWGMAVAMGLLTINILVVNNLRDVDNDGRVGKRTLAVRWGANGVRIEYLVCLLGAYVIPVLFWAHGSLPIMSLFVFVSVPMSLRLVRELFENIGRELNKTLAGTGRFELIYAVLFSIGLMIETLVR